MQYKLIKKLLVCKKIKIVIWIIQKIDHSKFPYWIANTRHGHEWCKNMVT